MAINKAKIEALVTANYPQTNGSGVNHIWWRIVGPNLGATDWEYTSLDFYPTNSLTLTSYLDSTQIKDCTDLRMEVIICPCCAIPNVDCGNPTPAPPTILPTQAYHDYIDIDMVAFGQTLLSTTIAIKQYYFTDISSYTDITVTGNLGCIFDDSNCNSPQTSFSYSGLSSMPQSLVVFGIGLQFTDGSNNTITPTEIKAYNNTNCLFTKYLYQIHNTDTTNDHIVYYQGGDMKLVSITVPKSTYVYICAIENTIVVTSNNLSVTKITSCQ